MAPSNSICGEAVATGDSHYEVTGGSVGTGGWVLVFWPKSFELRQGRRAGTDWRLDQYAMPTVPTLPNYASLIQGR